MSSLNLNIFPSLSGNKTPPNEGEDRLARESDVIVSTNITPHAEYKGFFIYVLSAFTLGCWIAWTLIPKDFLRKNLHIEYFPDEYWALAIPTYSLMLMLYIYIALALYNTEVKTLPLDSIYNFVDDYSTISGTHENQKKTSPVEYIHKPSSAVSDMPITLVNEVLFSDELENIMIIEK